jgi:LPS O-antigen subunit length determinant protein (WzzB/FepE family)
MKQNSSRTQDIQIDLFEFIRKLWKAKILIISVSLLFMFIGYVYEVLRPQIYKTTILLREAPSYLFETYRPFLITKDLTLKSDISSEFNNEFKLLLSSSDTLDRFVEKNNKIDELKFNLKEKNIDIRKLYNGKLETIIDKEKNISYQQYTLTFKEYTLGDHFLNDFIFFVKQESETMFKKQIVSSILDEINIFNQNLEIAKKINLENPNTNNYNSQDSFLLFNRGEKVLTFQIMNLNRLLNETKNLKIDYNPILEKSMTSAILKSPLKFAVIAFLSGLLLSIVIIFIQFSLQNRD